MFVKLIKYFFLNLFFLLSLRPTFIFSQEANNNPSTVVVGRRPTPSSQASPPPASDEKGPSNLILDYNSFDVGGAMGKFENLEGPDTISPPPPGGPGYYVDPEESTNEPSLTEETLNTSDLLISNSKSPNRNPLNPAPIKTQKKVQALPSKIYITPTF
jgi:hypothetical protein